MTFDGELPEFAFGQAKRRFTIGHKIALSNGAFGILQSGIVVFSEKRAYLVVSTEDGINHIVAAKLTDDEVAAYNTHPQTFFGRVETIQGPIENPLDLYTFFINGYKEAPKEQLLQFMATDPDIDKLQRLSREELLYEYAERLTRANFKGSSGSEPAKFGNG